MNLCGRYWLRWHGDSVRVFRKQSWSVMELSAAVSETNRHFHFSKLRESEFRRIGAMFCVGI